MEKSLIIKNYFITNIKNKVYLFFYKESDYGYIGVFLLRIFIPSILLIRLFLIKDQFKFLFFEYGFVNRDVKFILEEKSVDLFFIYNSTFKYLVQSYNHFIELFILFYICLCACVIFGFLTRFSSFVLLLFNFIFLNSCTKFIYGVDYITQVFLFYILLFPSGKVFSIDKILFKKNMIFNWGSFYNNPLPFYRILQIHMCLIYFFGGIGKSIGYNWWNGHSIWKALNFGSYFTGIDYSFVCNYPFILTISGIFIIFLETFYPLLIYFSISRRNTVLLIISMHLFIGVFMGLYYFSTVMIMLNIISFPKIFFDEKTRIKF